MPDSKKRSLSRAQADEVPEQTVREHEDEANNESAPAVEFSVSAAAAIATEHIMKKRRRDPASILPPVCGPAHRRKEALDISTTSATAAAATHTAYSPSSVSSSFSSFQPSSFSVSDENAQLDTSLLPEGQLDNQENEPGNALPVAKGKEKGHTQQQSGKSIPEKHLGAQETQVEDEYCVAFAPEQDYRVYSLYYSQFLRHPPRLARFASLPQLDYSSSFYRYTMVLDIDETILYTEIPALLQTHERLLDDPALPLPSHQYVIGQPGCSCDVALSILRPGLLPFLMKLREWRFEVVLFTSGGDEYAQAVMTLLNELGRRADEDQREKEREKAKERENAKKRKRERKLSVTDSESGLQTAEVVEEREYSSESEDTDETETEKDMEQTEAETETESSGSNLLLCPGTPPTPTPAQEAPSSSSSSSSLPSPPRSSDDPPALLPSISLPLSVSAEDALHGAKSTTSDASSSPSNRQDVPAHVISHALGRSSCYWRAGCTGRTKDLRVLNRDLARTIILDDDCEHFVWHPTNGIPIRSWPNFNRDFAAEDRRQQQQQQQPNKSKPSSPSSASSSHRHTLASLQIGSEFSLLNEHAHKLRCLVEDRDDQLRRLTTFLESKIVHPAVSDVREVIESKFGFERLLLRNQFVYTPRRMQAHAHTHAHAHAHSHKLPAEQQLPTIPELAVGAS